MKKILILLLVLVFSLVPLLGCSTTPSKNIPTLPPIESPEPPSEPETPQPPSEPEDPSVPETPQPPAEPEKPNPPSEPEKPQPPAQTGDIMLKATSGGLNVRSGRGTNYTSVGVMDYGDLVGYTSEGGGWYEINYKNKKAYVSVNHTVKMAFPKSNAAVERVIAEGKKLLGTPYVFGAQRYHWGNGNLNPNFTGASYDCSSYMQYIFKKGAGINLDTTSKTQSLQGTMLTRAQLRRGDLMFFTNSASANLPGAQKITHVGLYIGQNYILHTASDFAVVEEISAARWSRFVNGARHNI